MKHFIVLPFKTRAPIQLEPHLVQAAEATEPIPAAGAGVDPRYDELLDQIRIACEAIDQEYIATNYIDSTIADLEEDLGTLKEVKIINDIIALCDQMGINYDARKFDGLNLAELQEQYKKYIKISEYKDLCEIKGSPFYERFLTRSETTAEDVQEMLESAQRGLLLQFRIQELLNTANQEAPNDEVAIDVAMAPDDAEHQAGRDGVFFWNFSMSSACNHSNWCSLLCK